MRVLVDEPLRHESNPGYIVILSPQVQNGWIADTQGESNENGDDAFRNSLGSGPRVAQLGSVYEYSDRGSKRVRQPDHRPQFCVAVGARSRSDALRHRGA